MISFKTNTDKLLAGLREAARGVNDFSNRAVLLKELKEELEKFLLHFAAEFQAKYFEVAEYYAKNYGENLQPETLKVLNAVTNDDIHNAFDVVLEGDKINVVIDKDLTFFIGALEYGTDEVIADKTLTNVREKMTQIANRKIALFIQKSLAKTINR